MKLQKHIIDMTVDSRQDFGSQYSLLKLSPAGGSVLPEMLPGQFVQVEIPNSKTTYLRRPISINFVDKANNQLWLLVRKAGDGTRALCGVTDGESLNIIMPLGKGFTINNLEQKSRVLLVGGGVGVAPLLYLGAELKKAGIEPEFLLAARSKSDLLMTDQFEKFGKVYISTDDGSCGDKGLVTENHILAQNFDMIYVCGPMPMMKAVAAIARERGTECEVSLENKMACGLGACLCCVEKNNEGHNVCVCTEGPVFNIKQLPW